jgi:hypothetical protein
MQRFWSVVALLALTCAVSVATGGRSADQMAGSDPFIDSVQLLPSQVGGGYVCRTVLYPPNRGQGDYGSLWVEFKAGQNCSGRALGGGTIFSEGATSQNSDSRWFYDPAGLNSYAQMLQHAATTGQRVTWVACSPNNRRCIAWIYLRGASSQ